MRSATQALELSIERARLLLRADIEFDYRLGRRELHRRWMLATLDLDRGRGDGIRWTPEEAWVLYEQVMDRHFRHRPIQGRDEQDRVLDGIAWWIRGHAREPGSRRPPAFGDDGISERDWRDRFSRQERQLLYWAINRQRWYEDRDVEGTDHDSRAKTGVGPDRGRAPDQ